jgi:calcineurin-like phosphoesterase family protein
MKKNFFTSDLHFGHRHVMKHCPKRLEICGASDVDDVATHDEWLMDLWNNTVDKKDTVYILGDFSFRSPDDTKKLLEKLNGKKFLILGNHDKSSQHLNSYFEQITQIKEFSFKGSVYPFIDGVFNVCMAHYPMLDWPDKQKGSVMIHGHCHGKMDEVNELSEDLRVDIGLDGEFANYQFISLEQLYNAFMAKKENISYM